MLYVSAITSKDSIELTYKKIDCVSLWQDNKGKDDDMILCFLVYVYKSDVV